MIPSLELRDFAAIFPIIVIFGVALIIIMVDLFIDESRKYWNAMLALGAFSVVIAWALLVSDYNVSAFGGMFIMDRFTLFFNAFFCCVGGMTILLSRNYLKLEGIERGEFYVLLLISIVGMMLMAGAGDLIILFLGLETMSIPVYVLAGFRKKRAEGMEAALKYFLIGSFATGFLLYGIALIYGATGTTNLEGIRIAADSSSMIFKAGVGMIIVGLCFKISAVPFHMWTPDVYEGAPTPITGFMAVAIKAAGFAAFIRVFITSFPDAVIMEHWREILWVISVATMTVGNVIALAQTNIKRMLAYSSIAHAGYLLVGMVVATSESTSAMLFYLVAYALMNLGAFGCIILTSWKGQEGDTLKDFQGMGFEKPVMGLVLSIFLLSLAGIPPTAGFLGKFLIFGAAIKAKFYVIAILGVLNSAMSVYYYLRIIIVMYMQPVEGEVHSDDRSIFSRGPLLAGALLINALLTIVLGLWPNWVYTVATVSVGMFKF